MELEKTNLETARQLVQSNHDEAKPEKLLARILQQESRFAELEAIFQKLIDKTSK